MQIWIKRMALPGATRQIALGLVAWMMTLGCQDKANVAPVPVTAEDDTASEEEPKDTSGDAETPSAAGADQARNAATANAKGLEGLDVGEFFYGVYLQGNKVGWMRQSIDVKADRQVLLETELVAQVRGLGVEQEVRLEETRSYDSSGGLQSVSFAQIAATGATRVSGKVKDGSLKLSISAGGSTSERSVSVSETLSDLMAAARLAMEGEVGASVTSTRFDASVQKTISTTHVVAARESKAIAGVETDTVKLESKTPELGIAETSWYDASGTVLESQIGGFFVARLEPPEVAKKLDYSQDILIAAVVKAPKRLDNPEGLESLELDVEGFSKDAMPPSSPRQQVSERQGRTRIALSRDTAPSQPWPSKSNGDETARYLEATPFIQSQDPEILRTAREVVGDAKDVFTATSRLSEFVYRAVEDEYVPAYSNAKEALETRRGDCTEHAILFVALARALEIPARVAVGVAYWPPGGGFGWHAWAEVYAEQGWYAVDPTWNQPIADATHIKLAGGGPAEQARIVMLLGQLKIVKMSGS